MIGINLALPGMLPLHNQVGLSSMATGQTAFSATPSRQSAPAFLSLEDGIMTPSNPLIAAALPRSARTRKLLTFACIALSTALPQIGLAQAVVLLPDVCGDPSNTFDYRWAQERHDAESVFLMQEDGTVTLVDGEAPEGFNGFSVLYVAAHGGEDTIGGLSYDTFAEKLKEAHASVPKGITFAVCGSAKGPDSLLKKVNGKYGDDIDSLQGGVTGCALTGNGNPSLEDAEYRIEAEQSDAPLYHTIVGNIEKKWSEKYPESEQNYEEHCKAIVDHHPLDAEAMRNFLTVVTREFSEPAEEPEKSTDYHELVKLNKDGKPLSECGKDPAGKGPVPCP
jgi:hypothetical protein